jgi:thiol-disulfide isomerase/thioredoxin
MKNYILTLIILLGYCTAFSQQTRSIKLDQNSIVKDLQGNVIHYNIWQNLVQTDEFDIKLNRDATAEEFIIYRLNDGEKAVKIERKRARMASMPEPVESTSFKKGSKFRFDKLYDINGNKFDFKKDTGSVVVYNFWFINCPPCKKEIPDLNQLAIKYEDKNVRFVGIALDDEYSLRKFLKISPFLYNIIADGRYLAQKHAVKSYPTHVVVGKDGLVKFSTVGLAFNTVYWIDKVIAESL